MNAKPVEPRSRFWLTVAVLMIAELTCALESNMIMVALPKLFELYGNPLHTTWLVTVYTLASAGTVAMFARLGDLYGRKRVLMLMLVLAAIGSAISAVSVNLNVIILGRALQGVSLAILPLAYGIVRQAAGDRRQLNIGIGILGGTFAFSAGFGIVLGGFLVDHLRWQSIFVVSALAALASLALSWVFLKCDKRDGGRKKFDVIGSLTLVVPITSILLSMNGAQIWGWASWQPWALLAGGFAGLVCWIIYELRIDDPVVDLRLFCIPQVRLANLAIAVTAMGPMLYPLVLLPLLQQPSWTGIGLGISATVAGLVKLPTNITSSMSIVFAGYLAPRLTMRRLIIAAAITNLVAFIALVRWHDSVVVVVIFAVALIAPAGAIMFGSAPTLVVEATPEDRTSVSTGMTSIIRAVSMGFGTQMIAACFVSSSVTRGNGLSYPSQEAYLMAFTYMAVLSAIGVVISMLLPKSRSASLYD